MREWFSRGEGREIWKFKIKKKCEKEAIDFNEPPNDFCSRLENQTIRAQA